MALLTDRQIAEIVKRDFLDWLEMDEWKRIKSGYGDGLGTLLEDLRAENRQELATSDYTNILFKAQSLTAEYLGLDSHEEVDENDFSVRKLTRELMKSFDRFLDVWHRRSNGDYSQEPSLVDDVFDRPSTAPLHQAEPVPAPPCESKQSPSPAISQPVRRTIDDIIGLYTDECRSTDKWKSRTEFEILSSFNLFKQLFGSDRAIDSISRQEIAEYKQTLLKLPPNMNKMKEYRNKSIPEIIRYVETNDKERMSLVTVHKHLMRVKSLFEFAHTHGYIGSNPSKGISIDVKKKHRQEIGPFHDDDLFSMYNCETVVKNKFRYPYQFWILVLAPLTGCRLEELCQLALDDIRQENGIWVIDINENTADKKLKTPSSQRTVPLHPFLIEELNFIGFVNRLKKNRQKRLFPDLKLQKRGGYGKAVTRWFPIFREKAGVPEFDPRGVKRVFHSFRHSFDTRLKHQYVNTTMIDELMGHSVKKLSMGTYGERYPVEQLYEDGIMKLDFNFHDWQALKKVKYVFS